MSGSIARIAANQFQVDLDLKLSEQIALPQWKTKIGGATARVLANEGAAVLLVGRREQPLAENAAACKHAAILTADVTAADAGERIVQECHRRFGTVDVLVNGAGTSAVRSLEELPSLT